MALKTSPRVALLLHQYALELRARKRDTEAEPPLRRALAIQQATPGADARITIGVLNELGNLLQGRQQLDEAERPEQPETAANIANLGMLMGEAGQTEAAAGLLQQALAIYEKTLGPSSEEAKFVRDRLSRPASTAKQ